MICQECGYEWGGDTASCPECGFLASVNDQLPLPDPGKAKLKIKMRGSAASVASPADTSDIQAPAGTPTSDSSPSPTKKTPPSWEALRESSSNATVLPGAGEQFKDTAGSPAADTPSPPLPDPDTDSNPAENLVPKDGPVKSYTLKGSAPAPLAAPDAALQTKSQKGHWRGILLALVIAVLAVGMGGFINSHLNPPSEPDHSVATLNDEDVSLRLVNFAGRPLIVKIDNRVMFLNDGQTMHKTVKKGLHDISWRFTDQDSASAATLVKENVSMNADWQFSLENEKTQPTIARTVKKTL